MFFVYILECSDSSYYIGHTNDLERRLQEHQNRVYLGYTAYRLPVKLIYSQIFPSQHQAFLVERQLKTWSRQKKEALIKGDIDLLKLSAKKKFLINHTE
jgi:predicted GIY-YIG superfamily endonuclease